MEILSEYRNKENTSKILREICRISKKEIDLMEVCGGHTMAIQRFGIPSMLPKNIHLKSGPGCPVCVTSKHYIDQAIAYCRGENNVVATFGDLIRVPGSTSSLEREKARGHEVKVVYSPLEALYYAKENPGKNVIFLGIGFETTAPGTAATILKASSLSITNFFVFSAHKIMPPVMERLVDDGIKINGFIGPGHVSTIAGTRMYEFLAKKYGVGCVVSGFEPVDILQSVLMLTEQHESKTPKVEIQYKRAVKPAGNVKALHVMWDVFETREDWWRGLGTIPDSGLKISDKFQQFDAEKQLEVVVEDTVEDPECICGEVLKGTKTPRQCRLFNKRCDPANPVGACMVSSEGACQAYYRYHEHGK